MRGIAARLGVSATALYQHFESKASILREIRLYGADLLQTEVIDKAATHGDPVDCLAAVAQQYVAFARTHKWLYSVMMEHAQLDWAAMSADELELMLRPLRVFQDWLLCSMLNSGRIDERHPAFPFADQDTFVNHFIADTVQTLRGEQPA
ncbi:MAG: helix-turn-helix transcriptional regulator [Gemmatimonadetes bacterium]|nr:helix-turn-helix transcriptional regulator [Gemmatimonadota bacterium]